VRGPGDLAGRYRHLVPRHWFWMQVAVIVVTLIGMVIAITKLA
jgi:hypothetical protein